MIFPIEDTLTSLNFRLLLHFNGDNEVVINAMAEPMLPKLPSKTLFSTDISVPQTPSYSSAAPLSAAFL